MDNRNYIDDKSLREWANEYLSSIKLPGGVISTELYAEMAYIEANFAGLLSQIDNNKNLSEYTAPDFKSFYSKLMNSEFLNPDNKNAYELYKSHIEKLSQIFNLLLIYGVRTM